MPSAGEKIRAVVDPESDLVTTLETTTSTTFTDLTTVGPSSTISLLSGQSCLIIIDCQAFVSAAGVNGALASVQVAGPGASDLTASDANAIETGHVTEWTPGTRHILFTATAAGDHVITMKYRVIGAITGSFKNRALTVIPFP